MFSESHIFFAGNKTFVLFFLIVLASVFVIKEHFIYEHGYKPVPDYYLYKNIKPYGYGYRPYLGYNGYMYKDNDNLMLTRPVIVGYPNKYKLYGIY